MRFAARNPRLRFEIIAVLDYFVVRDNHALPVRLHADGELYDCNTRLQPHSEHYEDRRDAQAVADWLADRRAGYPSLKKFEGGANWPPADFSRGVSSPDLADAALMMVRAGSLR